MKKLIIGVGGALFNDGKILMLKRSQHKKFMPNMWEIPGGKVEYGETPEEALKREIFEETALKVEADKPYYVWSYVQDAETFYIEIDYVVRCSKISGIQLSEKEHNKYQWAAKNDALETTREMQTSIEKAWQVCI